MHSGLERKVCFLHTDIFHSPICALRETALHVSPYEMDYFSSVFSSSALLDGPLRAWQFACALHAFHSGLCTSNVEFKFLF